MKTADLPSARKHALAQPLQKLRADDPILKDQEFKTLLGEANDHLNALFSEFQKQSVPIIQENYMQRNMILTQCFREMETFKRLQKDAEAEIQRQFEKFKEIVSHEVHCQGRDLLKRLQEQLVQKKQMREQNHARRALLDAQFFEAKMRMNEVQTKLNEFTYSLNQNEDMSQMVGFDFFERLHAVVEHIQEMVDRVARVEEAKEIYVRKHDEVMAAVTRKM